MINRLLLQKTPHLSIIISIFCIWIISNTEDAQAEIINFSLADIYSEQHKLSDFRGKWVVVNYSATWCSSCVTEIPELIDFHEKHKDKTAVVIGISYEKLPIETIRKFTEKLSITYPIFLSNKIVHNKLGPVSGLPTTFLVSPEGQVVAENTGPITRKMIREYMEQY